MSLKVTISDFDGDPQFLELETIDPPYKSIYIIADNGHDGTENTRIAVNIGRQDISALISFLQNQFANQ